MSFTEQYPMWNVAPWDVYTMMSTLEVQRNGIKEMIPCWWEVQSRFKNNIKQVELKFLGAGSADYRITLSESEMAEARKTVEAMTR